MTEGDEPPLFIALPCPTRRSVIEALVAGVALAPEPRVGERRDPTDVRWVRMDGLHVTLRFLGPTAERIAAARAAVEAVASGVAPFELGVAGAVLLEHRPATGPPGWAWPADWRPSTS